MSLLAILLLGVLAGTVGGVIGFGSAVILMPALVVVLGAKQAVPVIAIASVMANASRAAVWWREVDLRVCAVYCATAIPAAAIGAHTMLSLDARLVEGTLGVFLILSIPMRRWLLSRGLRLPLAGFALVGAAIGFLTGLVATTGPVNTPFFLAHGLVRGAFLGTEAVGSAAVSLTKLATFRVLDALPAASLQTGLLVGSSLMLGSWLSRRLVDRIDATAYRRLLEVVMFAAGAWMLAAAVTGAG